MACKVSTILCAMNANSMQFMPYVSCSRKVRGKALASSVFVHMRRQARQVEPRVCQLHGVLAAHGHKPLRIAIRPVELTQPTGLESPRVREIDAVVIGVEQHGRADPSGGGGRASGKAHRVMSMFIRPSLGEWHPEVPARNASARRGQDRLLERREGIRGMARLEGQWPRGDVHPEAEAAGTSRKDGLHQRKLQQITQGILMCRHKRSSIYLLSGGLRLQALE
jgi:hypothetical protein